jgi:amphi-Trp domain-containing protein
MEQTPQLDAEDTDTDAEDTDAERNLGEHAYFSALVDGLRHGQLQFRQGDKNLSLEPSEQVAVEVKASRKGDRERVAFELEWTLAGGKGHELQG